MLQTLERFRQAATFLPVLGEKLAGLIVGEVVQLREGADLDIGGFVRHVPSTPLGQMSFLIVASAPPSISHLAPLT